MKQHHRAMALLFAIGCALLLLPSGALAVAPIQSYGSDTFDVDFQNCGLTIHEHLVANSHDILSAGPELDANNLPLIHKDVNHTEISGTFSANGKNLDFSIVLNATDTHVVYLGPQTVTLDDGSEVTGALYTMHESLNGSILKIQLPGGGTAGVDAGKVVYDLTVVLFADMPNVVLAQDNFAFHGPHVLQSGGPEFCQIIGQYLS